MPKQKWTPLGIAGRTANPGGLEFKPFMTLPLAMEAIRMTQHFDVHPHSGVIYGKPGDWLVHIDNELLVFTDKRFKEMYRPITHQAISALEAELGLLNATLMGMNDGVDQPGPPNRPWTATHGSRDISSPPSSFTAVTPPPSVLSPETIAKLRSVGAITTPLLDPRDQPPPTKGKRLVGSHTRDFFEAALQHQEAKGLVKYGTPLETFNGRDPLTDLLNELVGAVQYCSQAILERMAREVEDAGDL